MSLRTVSAVPVTFAVTGDVAVIKYVLSEIPNVVFSALLTSDAAEESFNSTLALEGKPCELLIICTFAPLLVEP